MIANRLREYLEQHQTAFHTRTHLHTGSSMETAEAARVPGDRLAKAVILEDETGPLMAVLPSDFHLDLEFLRGQLHRKLDFADEDELATLFPDCELGAVPPVGPAYGLRTIWDTRLADGATVFLEAGDHETLLEMSGRAFHELMAPAERGHFSHHA